MIILRRQVTGLSEAALANFVARAKRAARLRGSVNVLVTGNREMQWLNCRFRKKDKPTDVLSFPAMDGLAQEFVGEVAISAEIAARNARGLGHTVAEEIKILALHGLLHLAGYDHEQDDGEMARREARLRQALRLPVGLIERSGKVQKHLTAKPAKDSQRSQSKAESAPGMRRGRARSRASKAIKVGTR